MTIKIQNLKQKSETPNLNPNLTLESPSVRASTHGGPFLPMLHHHLTLSTTTGGRVQSSSGKLDLKEPYYRMSQAATYGSWYGMEDSQAGGQPQQQQQAPEAPPAQMPPDVSMQQHEVGA